MTIVCHVPRNEALARLDSNAPDAGADWHRYVTGWTAWNHLRTGVSAAAAATLAASLRF